MKQKAILAIGLSLLFLYVPVAPAGSPVLVGKVNLKGRAAINGIPAPDDSTLFSGDRISTEKDTAAGVTLQGGSQFFLPSLSTARVDLTNGRFTVRLENGALAVIHRSSDPVVTAAGGVLIQTPAGTGAVYEVGISGSTLKVAARKGLAVVKASNRTVEIPEGKAMEATVSPQVSGGLSPLMTVVILTGAAAGITALALSISALTRPNPGDCTVASPNQVVCP